MARLIHVLLHSLLRPVFPVCFALGVLGGDLPWANHCSALADDTADIFVERIAVLTLLNLTEHIARILIGNGVIVVNITRVAALAPASVTEGRNWGNVVHCPCHLIDSVNTLFKERPA